MSPDELGSVRHRRSGGVAQRLWRRAGVLVLDLWLVAGLVRMFSGSREHFLRDVALLLVAVAAVVALVCLGLVERARRRTYELRQHGLVLRGRGQDDGVVIPWATVDPGRIILSSPPRGVAARTPTGLLEWLVRPTTVLVNGWGHLPDGREDVASLHRYEPGASESPFGWWQLRVADPVDLLTAIESVMVGDGHPARGLAEGALSRRYGAGAPTRVAARELERGLTDPAVGVHGD